MIESLTEAQKAAMPKYVDKWLEIGLDTRECDRAKVESLIPSVYAEGGLKPPGIIEWALSPWAAFKLIREKYNVDKDTCLNSICNGNHDASWLSIYDYYRKECGLTEETEKLQPYKRIAKEVGWFFAFDEMVCFCEKPLAISYKIGEETLAIRNSLGAPVKNIVLHNEHGPCIEYRDGASIYALNGVIVPGWLVDTPRAKINCQKLFSIRNVEVRREFIRKVGMETVIDNVDHEVIDAQENYELILFNIGTEDEKDMRPYLKMINPSINTFHVEGVHPDVRTVDEALEFRNNSKLKPEQLT